MVVTGAPLEPGRAAGRLDAPGKTGPGQGTEHVVNGLDGHGVEAAADAGSYLLDIEVTVVGVEDFEYGEAWTGDPQTTRPEQLHARHSSIRTCKVPALKPGGGQTAVPGVVTGRSPRHWRVITGHRRGRQKVW
jgi:hypothetical protein